MDSCLLYPITKPFLYEDRAKLTKNPFWVKNVAGALGVIILGRKIPAAKSGKDWAAFSPWVEDTRNLWLYYRAVLSLAVAAGAAGGNAPLQEHDSLWAGNVAGFIYLASLTWNEDDDEMQMTRYMIQDFAGLPQRQDPAYLELMLLFGQLLGEINQIGLQDLQTYEPQNTYVSYCRSLRRGPYTQGQYSNEDADYRKALFVDTVAHLLAVVKEKDPGLRKIAMKALHLEEKITDITDDLFVRLFCFQLKKNMGDPSGRDYEIVANDLNGLLNRMDKLLTA